MAELILFRVKDEGDDETTRDIQKIETDDTQQYDIHLSRAKTENREPFSEGQHHPDTGAGENIIKITMILDETAGPSPVIAKLKDWITNPNTIKKLFPKGRIGMISTKRPEFTLRPTAKSGYKLVDLQIVTDFDAIGKTKVDIDLQFSREAILD